MKALLIYPKYPDTFFGFKHALNFLSKKAAIPPLGLITISAMMPVSWEKKLIDHNFSPLLSSDLEWADIVFISAMMIQKESLVLILEQCSRHKVKIVAGGPLFTQHYESYTQIDHFIFNEAEIAFPVFIDDFINNRPLKKIYKGDSFPDIKISPTPEFKLLDRKNYAYMNIQISRGCPFACDFCEIPSLLGHEVRLKSTNQIIKELDTLYHLKWRGPVFIVDDNFLGNKKIIKSIILPAMITWMQNHKYPFTFYIQCSIDAADDDELLALLTKAGINSAFIGIESPSEESLIHSNKHQNKNRDMLEGVRKLQRSGIQVSGGFIVGFDSDTDKIFQQQIKFIQESGIVWAMVGLLNAPRNTKLYNRLKSEGRLTTKPSGSNTDYSMNFNPRMDKDELLNGYFHIIKNVYSVNDYYNRIRTLMDNYKPLPFIQKRISGAYIKAFFISTLKLGLLEGNRKEYWKLLFWTLKRHPRLLPDTIMYVITGYHFRRVFGLE